MRLNCRNRRTGLFWIITTLPFVSETVVVGMEALADRIIALCVYWSE